MTQTHGTWCAATHRSRGFWCLFPPTRSRGCLYRGLFGNFGLSCPCVVRHAKTDIEMIDDDRTPSNPLRESLGTSWFSCHFCDVLWIGNEANTTFHHIDLPRIVVPGEAGWYFARSWSCRWCRCFVSKCLGFCFTINIFIGKPITWKKERHSINIYLWIIFVAERSDEVVECDSLTSDFTRKMDFGFDQTCLIWFHASTMFSRSDQPVKQEGSRKISQICINMCRSGSHFKAYNSIIRWPFQRHSMVFNCIFAIHCM